MFLGLPSFCFRKEYAERFMWRKPVSYTLKAQARKTSGFIELLVDPPSAEREGSRVAAVNCVKRESWIDFWGRNAQGSIVVCRSLFRLGLLLLLCSFPGLALAGSPQPPVSQEGQSGVPVARGTGASAGLPDQQSLGSISGKVVDQTGSIIGGVQIRLTREDQSESQEVFSDTDGQFSFVNVPPVSFQLAITLEGFATQVVSGTVGPGETYIVPQIVLAVETQVTQVTVGLTQVELAEVQIKDQEKQRVLGIIPNFYVSYVPNAVALTPKQKFELAWKSSVDPFTFVAVGAVAGASQAGDQFSGYGQGAQGYAKRYGAAYGDVVIGTFLGSAILPSLLKQDPRYFYKGTGSTRSRVLYALASPFICKGDNGRWQPDYSYVLGNFAAAGIANLYYPSSDRDGAGAVIGTALIRFGENAVASVFQEFVVRKLTRNLPARGTAQP
ncbi:MAG: carboxypeptidase regulatory-like domain-containing protein [Candidatus Acidiferrales bacterium]